MNFEGELLLIPIYDRCDSIRVEVMQCSAKAAQASVSTHNVQDKDPHCLYHSLHKWFLRELTLFPTQVAAAERAKKAKAGGAKIPLRGNAATKTVFGESESQLTGWP